MEQPCCTKQKERRITLWYYRLGLLFLLAYLITMHSFWAYERDQGLALMQKETVDILRHEHQLLIADWQQQVQHIRDQASDALIVLREFREEVGVLSRYRCPK